MKLGLIKQLRTVGAWTEAKEAVRAMHAGIYTRQQMIERIVYLAQAERGEA
jgi:hypothetical protein